MNNYYINTQFSSSQSKQRVLLKLSGAVFGDGNLGINPKKIKEIARQIKCTLNRVEVAIVVGGGNFFRGDELSISGIDRARADYMGMLGTMMNCLALQDFLEQININTRVQSAIHMGQIAESYIPRKAIRHLEKSRVVIFGAGIGLPYFSTDTVAVQRALEIKAKIVLIAKNGIDGIYTSDPNHSNLAKKFETLTYDEALRKNIKALDQTAFTLCKDNKLSMIVFSMNGVNNVTNAILGKKIGTLVTN